MPPLKINAELLPMKVHYFLFSAGTAPILLFGPTICKQLGYSPVTVGFIYTFILLLVFILKPLLCACADKYKQRRLLYLLTIAVAALSTVSFIFIPTRSMDVTIDLSCKKGVVPQIKACHDYIYTEEYNKELKEFHEQNNVNVSCKLTCKSKKEFLEELCNSWKIKEFCVSNSFRNNDITSTVSPKKIDLINGSDGKSSFGPKTIVPRGNHSVLPSTFSFDALLPSVHFSTIMNCTYAQMNSATFRDNKVKNDGPFCQRSEHTIETSCELRCKNSAIMELLNPGLKRNIIFQYEFWLLFSLILINWVSMAVNTSISDTICFSLLGNESHRYGRTRLFGSLGWGLSSFCFGWSIDYFSGNSEQKNYTFAYITGCIILLFNAVVGLTVRIEQKVFSLSVGRDVCKLFSDIRIVIFTLCCFYVGICSALVWSFLFWHLEDISNREEKLWSKTLQGLDAAFATSLGELPFFFISGYIIKKFGHVNSMSLVLLAFSCRLLLYSALIRPVWVLPIELLNGFSYGIFYSVMTSYANFVAPHGTETTVQGVFSASFDCFGVSFGNFIGGFVYEKYKGAVLYGTFGLLTVILCLLHFALQRIISSRNLTINLKDMGSSVSYSAPTESSNMLQERM